MKIQDIVKEAAETIRELEIAQFFPVIEEDKGNVATELATALGKRSLCVTVGWNGFTARIVGETAPGETPFGRVSVVATVFERPVVNRSNDASPRILDIAQELAKALDNAAAEGMDDALHFKKISPISGVGEDSVFCTVEFETSAVL